MPELLTCYNEVKTQYPNDRINSIQVTGSHVDYSTSPPSEPDIPRRTPIGSMHHIGLKVHDFFFKGRDLYSSSKTQGLWQMEVKPFFIDYTYTQLNLLQFCAMNWTGISTPQPSSMSVKEIFWNTFNPGIQMPTPYIGAVDEYANILGNLVSPEIRIDVDKVLDELED